jgi:hypothetical protein
MSDSIIVADKFWLHSDSFLMSYLISEQKPYVLKVLSENTGSKIVDIWIKIILILKMKQKSIVYFVQMFSDHRLKSNMCLEAIA